MHRCILTTNRESAHKKREEIEISPQTHGIRCARNCEKIRGILHVQRNDESRFELLLQAASQLDGPEEARDFLAGVCGDDPELAKEVGATLTIADPLAAIPATPDSGPVQPGQVVAERFQILRQLGEGGMAVVYEAIDTKLGERRALKFSKAGFSQTISPEARSAMRVTHNNICRIHEIHTTQTSLGPADFISMEYVEGETLARRCRRQAVSHLEAVEISRQLCRGIEAAHQAHILHRDLKSNNVMLARNRDGSLRVVVTDFGLARPMGGSERNPSSVSGTPNYIAPERWRGAPAAPSSEVYALGVILYEVLVGRMPFPPGADWRTRTTSLPEPPSRSPNAPDARWDAIVLRCMQPDPAKRFGSAAAVLEAIERTFCRSRKKQWAVVAGFVVLAIAPVVVLKDKIWPPPLARLAVLPAAGSTGNRALDDIVRGSLLDLAGRLEPLGVKSKRLAVIPFEESLRYEVHSIPEAAGRLRATHALSVSVSARDQMVLVKATVTDTRTGEVLREFTSDFPRGEAAALATSLAGVVTSAFHLETAPPTSVSPAAYPHYAAGLASLRRGSANVEPAIASFQEALKLDSKSAMVQSGLADALVQKFSLANDPKWLTEAAALARRAETVYPDSPEVLLALGRIERYEGHPERAVQLFQRAAELQPASSEAWQRTGLALHEIGRDAEAIAALRRAIQLDPQYYRPHQGLGYIHFMKGRHKDALDEFRLTTQLAPDLPEAHSLLGGALLAAEREEEAESALRKSIALRETRAALNNLSVLLRYQGRNQEAVQVLQRAILVGADDARLRLNLGNALRRTGRTQEARDNFQRAHDIARAALLRNPRDAGARAQLAYSMVRLGPSSSAADEALQAARLGASQYSVLLWTVMTLDVLGRRADAFPLLEKASAEQLKDLRRQPDLADFSRDARFVALLDSRVAPTDRRRK